MRRRLGDRGAAAVEFALVGPMFFLLILGILESGYMVFLQSLLDWGTRDAARLLRTGQAQQSANPMQTFQNQLCADASPMLNCGNIVYQSQVFTSWSGAQTAVTTPPQKNKQGQLISAGFTAGTGQQIVVVQVMYEYGWLTGWLGAGQSAFLSSTVAFRNEPFP